MATLEVPNKKEKKSSFIMKFSQHVEDSVSNSTQDFSFSNNDEEPDNDDYLREI